MNLFNSIKMTKPQNNRFDLSHDVKLSANMGWLVPTLAMECIPGDRHSIGCESLLRFAPLVSPVMHRCDVTMHYFFVPNRLLWPNWENLITNTKVSGALPMIPTITVNVDNYSPLLDYFGIPQPIGANEEAVNALPFAAYHLIYNEYYRDQNLIDEYFEPLTDGDNSGTTWLFNMQSRAWEHDYFTAALPFAQKGDPVTIPIGNFNDVPVRNSAASTPGFTTFTTTQTVDPSVANEFSENGAIAENELYADTSQLLQSQSTINDLRRAYRLQEWLEKAARGGSRYVENILSHFGVKSSDARLQRPEYITGTKSPVVISEVLNTTGTNDLPQGNMAGHAVSVTAGKSGSYYCEEHGWIIGIMSILPKTCYQQGIARHFLKTGNDPFQYYWPSFANIGEQEVQNRELYAFNGPGGDETFGYVPRYAEYKYQPSRVAGDFRDSLNFWHMGRIFAGPPHLNETFVTADPTHRVFAVTDTEVQKLYCHIYHKISSIRSMPKFGTPTF